MSKRNNRVVRLPTRKQTKKTKPKQVKQQQEVSILGKVLRGLGGLGGSAVGSLIGAPNTGSAVGTSLGAAVSKWLGAGDYVVSKNTLVARAASNIPMMHNTGQSVIVRHKEFVTSINGSVNFQIQNSFTINPALSATFPWLSSIASRFQEYEIKGMVWHYVPSSGTYNGSTAALGTVMLQTTYRATDAAPSSKVEMMNEFWSNEVVPFETMAHPIECDPKENPFNVHYTRTAPIVTGDQLLYDVGKTFVATQGQSGTGIIGDLWVSYEVELKKPLISSAVISNTGYLGATFTSPTSSNFFGSGTAATLIGNLPITFNTRTITVPPGNPGPYLMVFQIIGSALTQASSLSWTGTINSLNMTAFSIDGSPSLSYTTTCTGTNPTSDNALRIIIGVSIPDSSQPATMTLPTAAWSSGTTSVVSVTICTMLTS